MSGPFRGFLRAIAADVGLAIGMAAELEPPVERGMVGEQDVREKQETPARHLSAEVHAVERIGVAADEATDGSDMRVLRIVERRHGGEFREEGLPGGGTSRLGYDIFMAGG